MKYIFKLILNYLPRPVLIKFSYLIRPFIIIWFKGNRYTDPIDGRSFRKLMPYGYEKTRDNVLSPSTFSLERHRLLWLFLKTTDFFKANKKVLHFAPEQAFFNRFKKMKNLDYVTTDLNSPLADVKADICNLPFEDNTFDFILCNHVLEHINDDIKAIKELYRVMKPGGSGVFQIPLNNKLKTTFSDDSIINKNERSKIFGQYDHVRVYGMDYFDKLNSCGFRVRKINYTSKLSKKEIQKYCLNYGELIPFVQKPNKS